MALTMRDVAARAGVSLKTVSRVVNGEPHTSPEIIERVRAAVDELGWTPNTSARNLRTGRTGVIALAVEGLRRPSLAQLVEVFVDEVRRRGFDAAVEPTRREPGRLTAVLEAVGTHHDGVIVFGEVPAPPPAGAVPPVVVVGGSGAALPYDRVDEDVASAASLVSRHLALMGLRRPVLIGRDRGGAFEADTGEGPSPVLRAALAAVGIHDVPVLELSGAPDREAGLALSLDAIARHPDTDALICANDEVALGALAGLRSLGIDCPGQVAVIGTGNLVDGRFASPSLTTVDLHRLYLARAALDLLAERLGGSPSAGPRSVTIPVDLIRRESTMGRRAT